MKKFASALDFRGGLANLGKTYRMKQTPSAFSPGASAPAETMKERVRRVVVRLVTPDEMPRWIDLMSRHHYLGRPDLVGEVLGYILKFRCAKVS